jgi:dihydroorotate dehydrogenase
MDWYHRIQPLLFKMSPDRAHAYTLNMLKSMPSLLCKQLIKKQTKHPFEAMGLTFRNRVGIAAGFDKNGYAINGLFALGFGFVEIGGVTPLPQKGNPYPHVLRIEKHQSLINHCGLNNPGVLALKKQLQKSRLEGVVGVNLAANTHTPVDKSYRDFTQCLSALYPYADYYAINISCPNTHGRDASNQLEQSQAIIESICEKRAEMSQSGGDHKPLLVKISPDSDEEALITFLELLKQYPIEGIITGNTSVTRPNCLTQQEREFTGGLSGKLIAPLARQSLATVSRVLNKEKTIISLGGIDCAEEAKNRVGAGADLVQIYTGMIYQGPKLISNIAKALS